MIRTIQDEDKHKYRQACTRKRKLPQNTKKNERDETKDIIA